MTDVKRYYVPCGAGPALVAHLRTVVATALHISESQVDIEVCYEMDQARTRIDCWLPGGVYSVICDDQVIQRCPDMESATREWMVRVLAMCEQIRAVEGHGLIDQHATGSRHVPIETRLPKRAIALDGRLTG